jgi:hypothetical protein
MSAALVVNSTLESGILGEPTIGILTIAIGEECSRCGILAEVFSESPDSLSQILRGMRNFLRKIRTRARARVPFCPVAPVGPRLDMNFNDV